MSPPPPQNGAQNILVNQQQPQLQPGMAPQDPHQLFMPRGTPIAAGRPMAVQAAPLPLMEMDPAPPAMPGAMLPPPPMPWHMPIRPPQLMGYVPQYATGPRPAPIVMPAPPYAPMPPPPAPPPAAPPPLLASLFGRWRGQPVAGAASTGAAGPLAEAHEQPEMHRQQEKHPQGTSAQEGGGRRQLLRNRSKSWSSRSPRSPATAGPVGEVAESGEPAAGRTSPAEPAVGSKRRPCPLEEHDAGGASDDAGGDNSPLQGLRTDSARRAAAIERLSPRGLLARQARSSCPGPLLLGAASVPVEEQAAVPAAAVAVGAATQSSGGDTGSPRSPRMRQPVLAMARPGSSAGEISPASGSAPAAAYMPNAPMLLGGAAARALASSRARVSLSQEVGAGSGSGPASRLAEILATPPRRSGAGGRGSDAGGSAGPSRLRAEALSQPAPRGRFSMMPPVPPSHGRNASSARSEASIDDAMTSARVGTARLGAGPAGASGAGGMEGTSGGGARSSAGNTTWFDIASDDELVRRRTTDIDMGSGSDNGTGGGERGSGGNRNAARRAGPGPVAEGREGNLFALDRDPEGRAKRVSKIRQARRAPEAPLVNRPITGYIPGVRGGGGGAGPGGAGNAAAMAAAAAAGQGEWPGLAPRGETADGGLANWLRPPPGAHRDRGQARGRRSRSRGRDDDDGGGGGGYDDRLSTAASGDYGRGRTAGRLNTAGSGNYEPGPSGAPTYDGRSAFCASYGWLVADVVGNTDESALNRGGQRRILVANVVSLLRTLLLAGLLGGWAARTASGSMLQVIAVIAVTAGWLQYLLVVRPYVSILGLVAEAVVSGFECVLLVMAALAQGRVRMSPAPATLAIVALFIAVGVVAVLEVVRTVLVTIYIVKRMQQAADDADEASAGGAGKGGRARSSRVGAFGASTSGSRRGGEP